MPTVLRVNANTSIQVKTQFTQLIEMQALKIALLCTALFATAYAYSATYGSRNGNDTLLLNELVNRPATYNTYLSQDVVFPKSGQTNNRTITAIYVMDRFTNSSGAAPSIWSGGVGYKFATINLKSQYGQGISSSVEIYGK